MNIDLLRADTLACQHPAFFNNARASLIARPVAQAMINYQQCELDLGLNAGLFKRHARQHVL